MQNKFAVTSSPHLRDKATSQRIMQEVCLALAPAGIAGVVLFGYRAAILIAVCVITCVLSEFLWQKITKQKVTVSDWSAVVTGLLLAYNLPANAPWWMAMIGSVLAIVLVKQLFGGIGSNFMNPALTARAILFISWSAIVGAYIPTIAAPAELAIPTAVDAVTVATPLATLNGGTNLIEITGNNGLIKLLTEQGRAIIEIETVALAPLGDSKLIEIAGNQPLVDLMVGQGWSVAETTTKSFVEMDIMDLLLGNHGGVTGETCAIALILGGVYLMLRRIVDWRIPVAFIATVFGCYIVYGYINQYQTAEALINAVAGKMQVEEFAALQAANPALFTINTDGFLSNALNMSVYHLLSGGLLLGAFFMATDYATSPITAIGRVIFGIGCGMILFVIRAFCNYPEGCSFAILFMNVATPMIDRFTQPRPFGEVKKHG